MKISAIGVGVLLMSVVVTGQAQTDVITNTKMPWEMSAQELLDVTCRSYRDRAIASYTDFSNTIPGVSSDVFQKFTSEEDQIFDPSTKPEAERRAAFSALYGTPSYIPFRMRRTLKSVYASTEDYDPFATSTIQKSVLALIATHAVSANITRIQKDADDFVDMQHPANLDQIFSSISNMSHTTLEYSNCLALSISKATTPEGVPPRN